MRDLTVTFDALLATRLTGKGDLPALVDLLLEQVSTMRERADESARVIVAVWNKQADNCIDCGLPAVYEAINAYGPDKHQPLCSVCAAESASEGQMIRRVEG